MTNIDKGLEAFARSVAKRTSRRGALSTLGRVMFGASLVPLLPVGRAAAAAGSQDPGDKASCDYWRYCAVDGFLCECCGGNASQCPPGTEMSALTWIGTCTNPADNRKYIISYNDCCGVSSCGRCLCNTNKGDRPPVRPQSNNDTNWCTGSTSTVVNCTTAVIIGVASATR
ncbi:MAG: methylamine dehydrogenase (amicyanin) light chain [Bradyrhizobium sp.]|nr:methylamine dehydrogenase (amicyanin) light chain [Bradyrhizobium sp.]